MKLLDLSEMFDEIFKNADGAIKKAMPNQIQGQMPVMQKELDSTKNNNRQNWNNDNVTKKLFKLFKLYVCIYAFNISAKKLVVV